MLEYMGTTEGKFKFKDGKTSDYIYVIEFNRDDIKDRIKQVIYKLHFVHFHQVQIN